MEIAWFVTIVVVLVAYELIGNLKRPALREILSNCWREFKKMQRINTDRKLTATRGRKFTGVRNSKLTGKRDGKFTGVRNRKLTGKRDKILAGTRDRKLTGANMMNVPCVENIKLAQGAEFLVTYPFVARLLICLKEQLWQKKMQLN